MRDVLVAFVMLFSVSVGSYCQVPIVFHESESNSPGDAVLLYGGGLAGASGVKVNKLPDGPILNPTLTKSVLKIPESSPSLVQPSIQPNDNSIKFILPKTFGAGLFSYQVTSTSGNSVPRLLNRPLMWFIMPTSLHPGLSHNEASAGDSVQLVGKDFLLPGDLGSPMIAIRAFDGGNWIMVKPYRKERFSVEAKLPTNLVPGKYLVSIHNGFGGALGWSDTMLLTVKPYIHWPTKVFNVKDFGAKGDDTNDDTKPFRDALEAAEKNGGGVVYVPWGCYRFTDWICIPPKTTLKGEQRDAAILKWPVDEPKALSDFSNVAIYGTHEYAIEDLSIIVRKVQYTIFDLSAGLDMTDKVPSQLLKKLTPKWENKDVFLHRLNLQHWLLIGRPEQNKALWDSDKYRKENQAIHFWNACVNNFEASDCNFEGACCHFFGITNGRLCRNSFTNPTGYGWTRLANGANYYVISDNNLTHTSIMGDNIGLKYVYSSHNKSNDFRRGERECLVIDISNLMSCGKKYQYWGTPIEVGNLPGNVFLRFPKKDITNPDGFKTGFVPGSFKGGIAIIRAYNSENINREYRIIKDNTEDSILLDRSWNAPPDTSYKKYYIQIAPRGTDGGTSAYADQPDKISANSLYFGKANFIPNDMAGNAVLILDGKGTGQYREIIENNSKEIFIDKPWDIMPDTASQLAIWLLPRHIITYKNEGIDNSVFAQNWTFLYDYTVEGNKAQRTQGIWGLGGWFINIRNNKVEYANTYHPGIVPSPYAGKGGNMEHSLNFGFLGMAGTSIPVCSSLTLFNYGNVKKHLRLDECLPKPFATLVGTIVKGNDLSYNFRIIFPTEPDQNMNQDPKSYPVFKDIIVDNNKIRKSSVGVQIGNRADRVLVHGNSYGDVLRPNLFTFPKRVTVLDDNIK